MAREGRGEGTVGRRPRWVAAAVAAIVPAPRVSVGASAPGLGLGRRSCAPGRLELLLQVPGRPLPYPPPPGGPKAARGRGHVSRAAPPPAGPLRRRPGEHRGSQEPISGVPCRWQAHWTAPKLGLFLWSGPPRWGAPGPAPSGLARPARVPQTAGRLAGGPHPHVLPPARQGFGDG